MSVLQKKLRNVMNKLFSRTLQTLRNGKIAYDNTKPWADNPPAIKEAFTDFRYRQNIFLGKNIKFLRGAMVYADPKGKLYIGDDSVICRYVIIQTVSGKIKIGKSVLIGDFCSLYGQGGLEIGDNTMIAAYAMIVPNEHTFEKRTIPISQQPEKNKGIKIGKGVWIGGHVSILDGVTIGDGCIIGAGAVVTKSLPPYTVCAGVPAKVIKERP